MKIIHNGKEIEALTIKELYELALAEGKENAVVGVCYEGKCEECDWDNYYCEEVAPNDVEFGDFYNSSNGTRICDAVWLNSHEIEE